MLTDASAVFCAALAVKFAIDLFSDSIPRTVLICASCEVTSAFSMGFIGSWLRICATSSFRKRSSVPSAVLSSFLLTLGLATPSIRPADAFTPPLVASSVVLKSFDLSSPLAAVGQLIIPVRLFSMPLTPFQISFVH